MQKKILVTGGNGNLGKRLLQYHSGKSYSLTKDNWGQLETFFKEGVDTVIHTAYDLTGRMEENPALILDSNILSTSRILEACQKWGVKHFVFISTCAVYGSNCDTREDVPCTPLSLNGQIKFLNEQIVRKYCTHHGIRFEILRAFNTYGGDDRFSILWHLKKALTQSTPFVLNNDGISQRDFVHVEDVAKVILKLTEAKKSYDTFNIGTGHATSVQEIFQSVKEHFPSITVKTTKVSETEYSRANVQRLLEVISHEFIPVMDYLKNDWVPEVKAKTPHLSRPYKNL